MQCDDERRNDTSARERCKILEGLQGRRAVPSKRTTCKVRVSVFLDPLHVAGVQATVASYTFHATTALPSHLLSCAYFCCN